MHLLKSINNYDLAGVDNLEESPIENITISENGEEIINYAGHPVGAQQILIVTI